MVDPIVIVGAGPVGLTAAVELTRRGLVARIIDKRVTRTTQSRALAINPRSLDILEASGATERILAEGLPIRRARFVSRGQTRALVDLRYSDHRFPFMTALPQARTGQILEDLLNARGVAVERGVELKGLRHSPVGPVARIEHKRKSREIRASVLIGADGAHSMVRPLMGIGFSGHDAEQAWSQADVEAEWPFPPDEACFFFSREGGLFALPLAKGAWRLVFVAEHPEALLPEGARITRTIWRSRFHIAHRLADTFQSGRVFLAGDAAHVHSPAGARGMNGGIEDAATLAYLLDSGQEQRYEALRRPIAQRVLAQVERQTRLANARSWPAIVFREGFARAFAHNQGVLRRAARFVTGLDTPQPEWLGGGK